MSVYDERSLTLHRARGGKLSIVPKCPLKNREDLSIAYTPGVGAVVKAIAADTTLTRMLTIKKNTVAIVSDGSAILGLGNLGPEAAIPVMEGKAALFKAFADIDAFPICLATQDTREIIRTVEILAPVFGGINLEDISAPRCFEIEEELRSRLSIPVMHDDQHGTAVVVLAGLINAIKIRKTTRETVSIVVNGAGAAGLAIVKLLLSYGFSSVTVIDSKGAIWEGREDLNEEKKLIAALTNRTNKRGTLKDVITLSDVFIGVSKAGVLSQEMIRSMNPNPIIFALANPDPEIMPQAARQAGAFVVATGRSDFPNQINNVLAFPGLFRGALDRGIQQFDESVFIRAAVALAEVIDPDPEHILPDPFHEGIAGIVANAVGSITE